MKRDIANSTLIGVWVLALGAVGFACGFFGPIALDLDANQGPLLGIFITGPGGAAAGLVAGVVARWLPLTDLQRWRSLVALCIASVVGMLFACLPEPERIASIIDAEVRGFDSAVQTAEAATADWEKRIAEVTWSPPRKGWKSDIVRMLRDDPGVVLDVYVTQSRDIYKNRKPWNKGTRFAGGWRESNEEQRFFARFAGTSCEAYLTTGRQIYLPSSDTSSAWPPDLLPSYLGLQVLGPLPGEYRVFVGE